MKIPALKKSVAAAGLLAAMLGVFPGPHGAEAAELKQLAEQLVNAAPGAGDCQGPHNPQTGKEVARIRDGGRTLGAGTPRATSGNCAGNGIAIQEEGANVKKEKGVEDVE